MQGEEADYKKNHPSHAKASTGVRQYFSLAKPLLYQL
jgi:hypothetical protein